MTFKANATNPRAPSSNDMNNETNKFRRLQHDRKMFANRFIDSSEVSKRTVKYVNKCGISRYDNTLKNLIPFRQKIPAKETKMGIDDAGLFSFIYSTWLTKYLWKAYNKGILDSFDVPLISSYDSCSYNSQRLEILWNDELIRQGPAAASFGSVVWRFVKTRVLAACFLIFLSQTINFFCTMLLTRWILEYLENPDETFRDGLKYVVLLGIFDMVRAVLFSWAWMVNYRTALRLKAASLSLMYRKIIHSNNIGNKSTGELINTFSNDGQRIYDVIVYGPMIVCGPVIILFAIICILVWLSPIALLGIVIFLLFYPVQCLISRLFSYYRQKSVNVADTRIQRTIEALDCIKLIKMYAWEEHFTRDILAIREKEKKWLWRTACTNSFGSSLTPAVPIMTVIVTFLSHLSVGYNLTAAVAFPVAAYIISLKRSLSSIRDTARVVTEALISFSRLKSVLLLEDNSCYIGRPIAKSQALTINNARFVCELSEQSIERQESRDKTLDQSERERLNQPFVTDNLRRLEILTDITFEATKGNLIGVCGHVASGKSSLLLAALGQLKMAEGQLLRDGTCAYVSQEPWIVNTSLKENILFGETFDHKRYYEALSVCCLKDDVRQLPNRDETEIGERGVNLSGGQKQRVALARAFYANRDIYFLDDPLSAVDANVSHQIFENLILSALGEKTVVIVTHQINHLSRCDDIYLMRDGKIIEHGSHDELLRIDKEYANLVKNSFVNSNDVELEARESSNESDDALIDQCNGLEAKFRNTFDFQKLSKESQDTYAGFTQKERVDRGGIKGMIYHRYIKAAGGYSILLTIVLAFVLHSSIGVFSSWWLAVWLNAGSGNTTILVNNETVISDNINDNPDFSFYQSIYGSCFFLILVLCAIRGVVLQSGSVKASMNLHKNLLTKMFKAPAIFFDTTPTGRIQNLFSRDMEEVDLKLPIALESTLQNFFLCVLTFLTVITTLPYFTIPSIFFGILFYYVWKIYRAGLTNLKRLENVLRSPVYSFVTCSVEGLNTVRAFRKENEFLIRFQDLLDRNNACHFMCDVAMRWLATRFDTIASASTSIAALLVIFLKGNISPAIAGLALTYSVQMSGIFQYAIRMVSEVEVRFVSVERICHHIRTLIDENKPKKLTDEELKNWPSSGKIKFVDVELKYNKKSQNVLDNVSFEVENGEKIGIIGRTGSGKSSLVTALFRLYELSKGSIFIDDVDTSKIDLHTLRKNLTIIPQDPLLFSGTIRYYMDPAKNHTDAEIWDALERTQLKDRISLLPETLDAKIEYGGRNLSMGEKQLLCLARSLLRDTKILVLDEATASVDPETEAAVFETIQEQFRDCTVLVIAHRLQAVVSFNKVLVMDEGKIIDFKSPSELLNNENLKFTNMLAALGETIK